jgi:hypothetical protein
MRFIGQLLDAHAARYPGLGLEDIYKLLHQAALGPAHAVDGTAARLRLQSEIETLGDGPPEPLADPISPDGHLARVHLRPYLGRGLDPEALADAFAETARTWVPAPDKLARFCGCLGDLADSGGIAFQRSAVESFMNARAAEGWPAVHHSTAFRERWKPAYRVVDLGFLPAVTP